MMQTEKEKEMTANAEAALARPKKDAEERARPAEEHAHKKDTTRYRVTHGAVSGVGLNHKGERVQLDHHEGSIVTADQIDGAPAHYMARGALQPLDD
jgi:hypothetical protein